LSEFDAGSIVDAINALAETLAEQHAEAVQRQQELLAVLNDIRDHIGSICDTAERSESSMRDIAYDIHALEARFNPPELDDDWPVP
jgi:hypothetical protein